MRGWFRMGNGGGERRRRDKGGEGNFAVHSFF